MKKISMYFMMIAVSAMVMVSCGGSSDKEGEGDKKEGDKEETSENLVEKANKQVDALLEKIGAATGEERNALMSELQALGQDYKGKISEEEHSKIGQKVQKFMKELEAKEAEQVEETPEETAEETETEEAPQ